MLNQIIVQGRFTRDVEIRYTANNKPVVSFCIACERDIKKEDGTRDTDFIDCVAFGNTAEFISKYFGKGNMALVSGRVQRREWTAQNGDKRYSFEIAVNSINFCESKSASVSCEETPIGAPTPEEDEEALPF